MGHGPSRELAQGNDREIPPPSPELLAKLDEALGTLDRLDERFKAQRDDERSSQLTKAWHRLGSRIDEELRSLAKVLIASHQISLDVGSEGGGVKARPWMEETGGSLERLYFSLVDGKVVAQVGKVQLGVTGLDEVDHAWLEKIVVEWIVASVELRRKALTQDAPRT